MTKLSYKFNHHRSNLFIKIYIKQNIYCGIIYCNVLSYKLTVIKCITIISITSRKWIVGNVRDYEVTAPSRIQDYWNPSIIIGQKIARINTGILITCYFDNQSIPLSDLINIHSDIQVVIFVFPIIFLPSLHLCTFCYCCFCSDFDQPEWHSCSNIFKSNFP